jgi:tetratricopeptide (TPR) repeat protein
MKKIAKIALGVALMIVAGTSAVAQSFLEDPRYGSTPEERKTNVGNLNWLQDAVNAKNWNDAANYIRVLMNAAPAASQNLYIWGATTYTNKAARATSVDEKKTYVDSVMLIYDRRAQNFGSDPNRGTPYILQQKANAYLGLSPMDRAGVRKFYKDAVDASGNAPKSDLVLAYFQQMVNDYKSTQVTPEELLGAYGHLAPFMENATAEEKDGFTGLFATSGAADCGVLEDLYTKELAAKPGDVDVLSKAFGLMSMAGCDSDFYLSVGEQYYAAKPSSDVAIRLATIFEKKEQFDKAIPYLNEQIESETDPAAKSNLYVRIAASELGQKRYSAAAQAARQAVALESGNGYARMFLAEAYLGGAAQCGGFAGQTASWIAYDEFVRARDAFAGDAAMQEAMTKRMGNCAANFPTTEDAFMNGIQNGDSYTVRCGWISGTTTARTR